MRVRGQGRGSKIILLLSLSTLGASAVSVAALAQSEQEAPATADEEHAQLFSEDRFPSASTCASCHPDHYREWSVSPHAYAQMSPVFNAFHGALLKLTNGTNGDFCIRCHTPVGMNLGEPEFMSNMDRHPTSREGVTCIACHRVDRAYGKLSGRLAIVEGDPFEPVFGPRANTAEFEQALEDYPLDPEGRRGQRLHAETKRFFQLREPGFCGTCHDVNLVNGFRLEEAFSEYKTSPAARNGVTCQDCHMGREPGKPSGYHDDQALAILGKDLLLERAGTPVELDRVADPSAPHQAWNQQRPARRTNHMFIGPDYSVVHPGIFPHNTAAQELATIRQWLEFDVEAGWGTDVFEDEVAADFEFPEHWRSIDDRYDARDIIAENQALLAEAHAERKKLLQAGYGLGEIEVTKSGPKGLEFRIPVLNLTDGHGVPTGFDAERLVFLRTTVTDAAGEVVFESGDLDPNGDVRDLHSLYVHNGELPLDKQLFSLQGRFVTRMARGGEREQVLAINYSPTPLVFLRPSMTSTVLTGRPLGARKHKQNIEPLGRRMARYKVKARDLTGESPYAIRVEIIAGMIPVNLLTEIGTVGFDYYMSPREVADRVVAGHQVLWTREATAE